MKKPPRNFKNNKKNKRMRWKNSIVWRNSRSFTKTVKSSRLNSNLTSDC